MISGTRHRLTVEINRQTQLSREIGRIQTQISSGKRLESPSDDPAAAARISDLARALADEESWRRNLDAARVLAERGDTALTNLSADFDSALELLVSGTTGTVSAENREVIARGLDSIASAIDALAATKDPHGNDLFRTGAALEIPVIAGGTIVPVALRDEIFGNVATPGGPRDLATIVRDAAAAIREPDPALRTAATRAALDAMNSGITHVAAMRADQGVRAGRIEALREQLELSSLQLEDQKGTIEGTDIPEAVARLESLRLSLQAAQAVFARVGQNSLFDLLR